MTNAADERDERLARIIEGHLAAMERGESASDNELLERNPEFADELRECLGALEFLKTAHEPTSNTVVGDYRLGPELGRGGMGIVYEAEQLSLARQVALKVVVAKGLFDGTQVERFQREAQAAARLHHPHIVPVYDVGHDGERHFYAMQYIEGASLDHVIAQLREIRDKKKSGIRVDLPNRSAVSSLFAKSGSSGKHDHAHADSISAIRAADSTFESSTNTTDYHRNVARLFADAADALDYAHRQGIVHRDVKPSNFLLDTNGGIWLTDFGLAKLDESSLTKSNDVLGTLRYMPPESYYGRTTLRSDLFGLGLTMYEMLALHPAYDAVDRSALLRQVTAAEIRSLREIVGVPRDLETIVMKLLRSEPTDRYESAVLARDDLERFVSGEPILARPISSLERSWRWCNRNRLAATLASLSLALLLSVAVISSIGLVAVYKKSNTIRSNLYAAKMVEAAQAANEDSGLRRVAMLVDEWADADDLRGWEWYYLKSLLWRDAGALTGHGRTVYTVCWSPDGSQLLSASHDGTARVWDANSRKVVDAFRDHDGSVRAAFWCPDGTKFASGGNDGTVVIREVASRRLASRFSYSKPVNTIAWNSRGTAIAAGYVDGKIIVWNLDSQKPQEFNSGSSPITRLAWHPNDTQLAASAVHEAMSKSVSFHLWDLSTSTEHSYPTEEYAAKGHRTSVYAMSFAADGRLVTAGADRQIIIWNSEFQPMETIHGHHSTIYCARWIADREILTASRDRTICAWDLDSRTANSTYRGHHESVLWVDVSPDGRRIASAGVDGLIKLWDVDSPPEMLAFPDRRGFAWGPDAEQFATAELSTKTLMISNLEGKHSRAIPLGDKSTKNKMAVDWSPDGRRIAAAIDGTVTILTVGAEQVFHFSTEHINEPWIQWCPDGKRLLLVDNGHRNEIEVYNAETGNRLQTIRGRATGNSVAWSPCGKFIAGLSVVPSNQVIDSIDVSRRPLGNVKIWDASTGEVVITLPASSISGLAWHPDGKLLATADDSESVKVWNVHEQKQAYELFGHRGAIASVAWNVDGSRLASGDSYGNVKIWDPEQRLEVLGLKSGSSAVTYLEWSPDGRKLASWTWGDRVLVWDATRGFTN